MKSLVVEDDLTSRELLQTILDRYGPSYGEGDGILALDTFIGAHEHGAPYDLVCLDIMLPNMDGQEILKRIREWEGERGILGLDGVKIIMTTGLDDSNTILTAFRSQCEGYIVKPVTIQMVVDQLVTLGLLDKKYPNGHTVQ